jgi:hypothetical protein
MNVTLWELYAFDRFLDVVELTTLTLLSLLISCKLSFRTVSLKYLPYLRWHKLNVSGHVDMDFSHVLLCTYALTQCFRHKCNML